MRDTLALLALLASAGCSDESEPMPPAELFEPSGFVYSMASDADFVYWTDRAFGEEGDVKTGRVMCRPRAGGPAEVLATQQDTPRDLMISESAIYWIDQNPFYLCGKLLRRDRASGAVRDLTSPDTCLFAPVAERNGRVLVIGKDESAPTWKQALLAIDPAGLQPPELRVRLGTLVGSDYTIRGDSLFVLQASEYGTREVVRVQLDGSSDRPSETFRDTGRTRHFEVDETYVYWVDEHVGGGNDLIRQPQNNFGDYERLAQFDDEPLGRPILDETYVWVPVSSGPVEAPTIAFLRVPREGGELERFEVPYEAYMVVPDHERFIVASRHGMRGFQLLTQPRP